MTKKIYITILFFCIITLVQVFGLSRMTLFHVSVDALTIFLAFIAVTASQKTNTSFGFVAGVLEGLLTGNMGLHMLARTVGSFIAGYFHTPKESHTTIKQNSKRFYGAVIAAGFCANAIMSATENPLGFSPAFRIVVFGLLESFFNLILAVIVNWLFLRQSLAD